MPPKPVRYQQQRCLHFITFSCYHRLPFLNSVEAREIFERELDRVREWYGCYIAGYVVMPEHVHLLISEPERNTLSVVIQMLKQITSHKLKSVGTPHFWQKRYYGFPVWSERKRVEKLRYIHQNPVKRGLVDRPEDWRWSSFRQWADGDEGTVEVECSATARKRERMGMALTLVRSHPVAQKASDKGGATQKLPECLPLFAKSMRNMRKGGATATQPHPPTSRGQSRRPSRREVDAIHICRSPGMSGHTALSHLSDRAR